MHVASVERQRANDRPFRRLAPSVTHPRFDVVLIGTGPPMLLEGLWLAEAGQRVVFIDRAAEIGGSWATPSALGYRNVELGVHLIENRPHLNALMENLLGVDRLIENPPDFGLVLGRRVPIRPARVLLYALVGTKAIVRRGREQATHAIGNSLIALRCSRVPLVYPAAGFAAVLDALGTRLIAAGAEFRFDTAVHRVAVTDRAVVARTDRGDVLATHFVMSSRAHAPIEGLEWLWRNMTPAIVSSAVIQITGGNVRFDGYVEIFGEEVIRRVRNISKFATPQPPKGAALIVVQFRKRPDQLNDEVLSTDIVTRMRRLGLLGHSGVIAGLVRTEVTLNTLSKDSANRIAKLLHDRVTVLPTVDLSDRIHPLHRG